MNKTLIASSVAALIAVPLMPAVAQTTDSSRLDAIASELKDLKEKNERLEAEVEYLKANALAERKDQANEAVTVAALSSTAAVGPQRWTWSGDFRARHEYIDTEENVTGRSRERIRARFGFSTKVNDSITARLQLATTSVGTDNQRSTNQTLGTAWDKKPLSIDLAFVDWKASDMFNLQLGKMPIPFTTTVSYFWDKDLTPEGAALKWARGPWFANAYYDVLSERDSATSSAASTDATMTGVQLGLKQPIGKATLTAAVGYTDFNALKDRIVSGAGTGCTIDGAFGSGQGTGNNAFGNTTYTAAAPQVGSSAVCTRLLNDFNVIEGLVQLDVSLGKYPLSLFVDYIKNNGINSAITDKQDTGYSAGFVFNRAGAAKTWELGYTYQKAEKDAQFGGFYDSDFGGGVTDTDGSVIKVAYVPATNWTLNGTYFMNNRFIDNNDAAVTRDYKRLQLDLNYKY